MLQFGKKKNPEVSQFIEEYRLKDVEGKIHSLPCPSGVRSFNDLTEADLRGRGWEPLRSKKFLRAVADKLGKQGGGAAGATASTIRGRASSTSSQGSTVSTRSRLSSSGASSAPGRRATASSSGGVGRPRVVKPPSEYARQVVALYDFQANREGRLSFVAGDKFKVMDDSKMWWAAKASSGKIGRIPSNYMENDPHPDVEDKPNPETDVYSPIEEEERPPELPPPLNTGASRARPGAGGPGRSSSGGGSSSIAGSGATPIRGRSSTSGGGGGARGGGGGRSSAPGKRAAIPVPINEKLYDGNDSDDDINYEKPDQPQEAKLKLHTRTDSIKFVPEGPKALPANPLDWDTGDVMRWLKDNGLDDFVEVVYSNGFEGDKLMLLTGESFKEGGFDPARCDVLGRALDKLKRDAPSAATSKRVKALFDFDALKKSHLSMRVDEVLDILDDVSSWWVARNSKGEQGKVPSNYVEVIEGAGKGQKRMEEEDWFAPTIERKVAESNVVENGTGSFLVRPSKSQKGSFTVTVCGHHGKALNLLIKRHPNGSFVMGDFSDVFNTVGECIEFHKTNPLKVQGRGPALTLKEAAYVDDGEDYDF